MKNNRKVSYSLFLLLLFVLTGCGRGEKMRQRMQFVAACNRADTVFTSPWCSTVDSLVDYFSSHGTENERMMAFYLKGRVHHDIGEAPQALEAYQRATEQVDTMRKDCDLRTLCSVYGQMADLFHAQYLPDNEKKALQMAEKIAWKNKDTLSALVAFDLRSRPYFIRNEIDSVLLVEKQARALYLKYGYKEKAAQAILGSISILLDQQRNVEANRYIKVLEQESGWFDADGNVKKGKERCYYDKGRYLMAIGQPDSACYYFYKVLAAQRETGCRGLLSVYEKKKIPDSIAKYAKLFAAANDSLFLHVNQEKVHQISAMFDYSHHQQLAEQKTKEVSNLWNIIFFFLLVLLLAVGVFFFYRTRKLSKISRLMERRIELENLLTEKQQEIELHKSNSENISEKQYDEIKQLKQQLQEFQSQISSKLSEKQRRFYGSEIYHYVTSFKDDTFCHQSPTKLDWKSFVVLFRESFPRYYQFIAEKNVLTEDQFKVCLLARLFLPVYAMARILDVDSARITRIKSQANKKLFKDEAARTFENNLKKYFEEY